MVLQVPWCAWSRPLLETGSAIMSCSGMILRCCSTSVGKEETHYVIDDVGLIQEDSMR